MSFLKDDNQTYLQRLEQILKLRHLYRVKTSVLAKVSSATTRQEQLISRQTARFPRINAKTKQRRRET